MADTTALLGLCLCSSGGKLESIEEELGMNLLAGGHTHLSLGFEQEWKVLRVQTTSLSNAG